MNELTSSLRDILPLLGLFVVLTAGFGIWLAIGAAHKSAIARAVRDLGATTTRIEWMPFYPMIGSRATHYQVTLRLATGQMVSAMCQCSLWSGVYWKTTPWMQFGQPVQPVKPIAECKQCAYPTQTDWRCCPKCGNAI